MGHVYFIRHKRFSPVKIGHTKDNDVMKRLNSFNTSSPYGIEFLGSIESFHPDIIEKEIHDDLEHWRLNGEWFDIDYTHVSSIIGRYPYQECQKRRVMCDIPYSFNYKEYDLDRLKIFRQFFYKFNLNQDFDFELAKRCIMDAIGKDVKIDSAKIVFNDWAEIASLNKVEL